MKVVDASVALKWFLKESDSAGAIRVARDILCGRDIYLVPELFYFEVYAVVIRKHDNPKLWADQGCNWLFRLPLRRVPLTLEMSRRMEPLCRRGLTGYDAAYAALAQEYNGQWLTYDRKAAQLLNHPRWIRVLG